MYVDVSCAAVKNPGNEPSEVTITSALEVRGTERDFTEE